MQYSSYVRKNGKDTRPEELAKMASDMAEFLMDLENEKPGCAVESAKFIIHEDTISWMVVLIEPGEGK